MTPSHNFRSEAAHLRFLARVIDFFTPKVRTLSDVALAVWVDVVPEAAILSVRVAISLLAE